MKDPHPTLRMFDRFRPPTFPCRPGQLPVEQMFRHPPILDVIFEELSPADMVRVGRTCRLAWHAIEGHLRARFNVNRHLSRYFDDPLSFRCLQARTGTLISGSNALQFLDRSFYRRSDLDLYAHPGFAKEVGRHLIEKEGYVFEPGVKQKAREFDMVRESKWKPWTVPASRPDLDLLMGPPTEYRVTGLVDVYRFRKRRTDRGQTLLLEIQVMASEQSPLHCILNFHSTCVMNFITFEGAYSLYPRATLEERGALCLNDRTVSDHRGLAKYSLRGWTMFADQWHGAGTFYADTQRWVGDGLCWRVGLDMTGLELRGPLTRTSPVFTWDPAAFNSWVLTTGPGNERGRARMTYLFVKPTIFRFTYLAADEGPLREMERFLREQGTLENAKKAFVPARALAKNWTWWDGMYPSYVERYLKKIHEAG